MSKHRHSFVHSITFRLILAIFLLLLPVVFLSAFINYQFMKSGMERIVQSHEQVLEGCAIQLDHELDLAENYMNSLTFYNGTTVYLTEPNAPSYYYAVNDIDAEITKTALFYHYISGFFIHVPSSDLLYLHLMDSDALSHANLIRQSLRDCAESEMETDLGWHYRKIGDTAYLMQGFHSNGIWGGSMLNLDTLPHLLPLREEQTIGICFLDQLDEIRASLPPHSVLTYAASEKCELCIYEQLNEEDALSSLPFLQRYFVFITLIMLLCIPFVILALQHMILSPLIRLTNAMHQLEIGLLDTALDDSRGADEFRSINRTFNHMAHEIKSLKIAVYEEQLEKQRIQTQNLSYQLRPHFMVNTLNMAYNLILSKEYSTAARLMRFSASYMRYLLRLDNDYVLLKDELRHLEDYLSIQLLRYEGQFRYEFEVNPFVEDIFIPSMVLQNFIENSIKYSIGPDHFTLIQLVVDYCEVDDTPCAVIMIRDNGNGYPEWLLRALHEKNMAALRDRVGLRNTIQRIQMLYGDKAAYHFYNDNGAVNQFTFPLDVECDISEKER